MASRGRERIIVAFCGRFLSEKADALFAHESASAFAKLGRETLLIAPRRFGRSKPAEKPYRLIYLPTLDLFRIPYVWAAANIVNLFVFSLSLFVFLLLFGKRGDVVLCNEPIPLLFASLVTRNILYEVHVLPKKRSWLYGAVLSRTKLLLPITAWNAKIGEPCGFPSERVLVARSAVNVSQFRDVGKKQARVALGLPEEGRIALYTGHLFSWKGVDTLAQAARLMPEVIVVFVGGTKKDVADFRNKYGNVSNIKIIGYEPHKRIPLWQAAADVLVLPNSAREQISIHYTSPMKLFEYMASGRPIVASDLPSIKEVLPNSVGYFASPDDPASFVAAIGCIFADPAQAVLRAREARAIAEENTWEKRSRRVLERLSMS